DSGGGARRTRRLPAGCVREGDPDVIRAGRKRRIARARTPRDAPRARTGATSPAGACDTIAHLPASITEATMKVRPTIEPTEGIFPQCGTPVHCDHRVSRSVPHPSRAVAMHAALHPTRRDP